MFRHCDSFNQDLSKWRFCTHKSHWLTITFKSMFDNCVELKQDFNDWSYILTHLTEMVQTGRSPRNIVDGMFNMVHGGLPKWYLMMYSRELNNK